MLYICSTTNRMMLVNMVDVFVVISEICVLVCLLKCLLDMASVLFLKAIKNVIQHFIKHLNESFTVKNVV